MKKRMYFDSRWERRWPDPIEIEHFFLAPPGKEWFYTGGNDTAGLKAEGVHGTQHLTPYRDRIDVTLSMWGNPKHGVLLLYRKWGGGFSEAFTSKGDLTRLREWVRNLHNDPMPVGLFISFREAWKAVKEFIETDGELPKSIEWIANSELPAGTFPDP